MCMWESTVNVFNLWLLNLFGGRTLSLLLGMVLWMCTTFTEFYDCVVVSIWRGVHCPLEIMHEEEYVSVENVFFKGF